MHIITRKRLNEFAAHHPDALNALQHWYQSVKHRNFENFAQLREVFSTTKGSGKRTKTMTVAQIEKTKTAWPSLAGSLYVPHTQAQYQELVDLLDGLIDEVGEDERHPLASLMEVIGVLIEKYEDENISELA